DGIPLKVHYLSYAIAKGVGDDEYAAGQSQAHNSKERLQRFSFQIADRDAKGVREKSRDAAAFQQSRAVIRRWFRAHRFGGGEARRATNSAEDAERRRTGAHQQR